jgi:predicted secreted hydrolase
MRPSDPSAANPRLLSRRHLLLSAMAGKLLSHEAMAAGTADAGGQRALNLAFPRDFGSHPDHHIEWWYITGHARTGSGAQARDFGFQITFFRTRVEVTQQMQSRFAARHLLFAHAAVTEVQARRFWHDQRIARAGFEVASASETDTALRLRDWSLVRGSSGSYQARIAGDDFALDLAFTPTQEVLLQGDRGLSRKGPQAQQYSAYYSLPQLAFDGAITVQGTRYPVSGDGARTASPEFAPARGAAWLDHEWSNSLLDPAAVGWDWLGMNLFDGSSLTAFRIRDKGGQTLWDGGSFRHPRRNGGKPAIFSRGEAVFQAVRGWKSPLTQATYPVEWTVRTPASNYGVRALLDNQELDSRNSTGAVYWEGLCDLTDGNQRPVGRGYLEMTGYARPLVL